MPRILIVDDAPLGRDAIAKLLQQEGFETAVARNGTDALIKLKDKTPDLILLDHMMPEVDGLTFLSGIRRFPKWKQLPVMMLTATRDRTAHNQAQALKLTDYIVKAELSAQQIIDKIKQHFGTAATQPAI
jgi:CheY-like chemotaxis protein